MMLEKLFVMYCAFGFFGYDSIGIARGGGPIAALSLYLEIKY